MTVSQNKELKKLNGQRIGLLGLGLDNLALIALLNKAKTKATITICDFRSQADLPKIKSPQLKINYQLGAAFNKNLDKFDLLFRSPGWPLSCPGIKEAQRRGQTTISSPLNLFFSLCPTKNIIGVTGTKGKGTTATLIYKIIKDANYHNQKQVFLGGNIGVAPLSFIAQVKAGDFVVLELSSFQLEDLRNSPLISIITNLYREHLAPADPNNPNFHATYNKYWQAKLNIAKNKTNKYLVINQTLKNKIKSAKLTTKIIFFGASLLPSRLTGDYNRENIAAAVATAKILKISPTIYKKTIAGFTNLPHRLEFVLNKDGLKYFDNSFSTTPESTILDIKSFREPLILIAGGADKGANFRPLAQTIKNKVKFLILLAGQATPRIKKELLALKFPKNKLVGVKSMSAAVAAARSQGKPGDIVLLSTACASFGLFKNYKERGDQFQTYARQ